MIQHGFLRIAAACPAVRVADGSFNAARTIALLRQAEAESVCVVVFPELGLTGYTCGDLFQQSTLQRSALVALAQVLAATPKDYSGVAIVGLPLAVDDQLFNVAAVLHRGQLLGLVPKTFLPNYKEFYERRWFAPAGSAGSRSVNVLGQAAPFGTDLLFTAEDVEGAVLGVELCEDLWTPIPPSSQQALAGATLLLNLSASNDLIGKSAYRKDLVVGQSGRCVAVYAYSSCGVHESTTDVVYGGHCMIAENGVVLAESPRFEREGRLTIADVDLERVRLDRQRLNSFGDAVRQSERSFRRTPFRLQPKVPKGTLRRFIDPHPFVPRGEDQLRERCEEIFQLQVAGLAKRLEHVGKPGVAIGVSGGLDSTLALLVTCKTIDALKLPRASILGFTMPGFGTTPRTLSNALTLMKALGVAGREVDIRSLCLEEMRALGHHPFGIDLKGLSVEEFCARLQQLPEGPRQDLVFENVQARMRMNLLLNSGFVIGTADLSEMALGWCTYGGDHISMYNPNVSIPKTLVRFLVRWVAQNEFASTAQKVLMDVVNTVISPELLPVSAAGEPVQETEQVIGPYELHDFFLFHFLRHGASPEKLLFLAEQAEFESKPEPVRLRHWLRVFLQRFFANQFKRSCLPDGPKVGTISLSPRGDWRMPSDAHAQAWLRNLEAEGSAAASAGR